MEVTMTEAPEVEQQQQQASPVNKDVEDYLQCEYRYLQVLMDECTVNEPIKFEKLLDTDRQNGMRYIGSGKYARCYKYRTEVYKIMEITNRNSYDLLDLLGELKITKNLSDLRNEQYTDVFPKYMNSWVVWDHDLEIMVEADQEVVRQKKLYMVHCLEYGGQTLQKLLEDQSLNMNQIFAIIKQITLGLAVAEFHFDFEHRDLMERNIVLQNTGNPDSTRTFKIGTNKYEVATYGYHVTIIDFTLSRAIVDNEVRAVAMSLDDLDYRHHIIGGCWDGFFPHTNVVGIYEMFICIVMYLENAQREEARKWLTVTKSKIRKIIYCRDLYKMRLQ